MDTYVIYVTHVVPIKRQLPDVQYMFLSGSIYNPEYTTSDVFAMKFYELNTAKNLAESLGMKVGKLVMTVEEVK